MIVLEERPFREIETSVGMLQDDLSHLLWHRHSINGLADRSQVQIYV